MVRQIIKIDENLCNGCGICVSACHEGAIGLVDGKAKLLRDDYCDGLGNCLPVCPTGAISFETREALDYNEDEVKKNMERKSKLNSHHEHSGCPGSGMIHITINTMLNNWPIQIKLVPFNAPYFNGADLLIAADCTAYSYGKFNSFINDKITLIGCPKLDDTDYSEKLIQIFNHNQINSITVIRMEVPCCGGIVHDVKTAIIKAGKQIPLRTVIISIDGKIVEEIG